MTQTLIEVAVDKCKHSRFNTRKTRGEEHVKRLAERIERNGFEKTRAPWAVQNCDCYEVFAGGTRLEAARVVGLTVIPIFVHDSLSDEEVARLADQDNENDEYHVKVSLLDVWAEYHRLWKDEGWTQQKIADAKGVQRTLASERINWHEAIGEAARSAVSNEFFDEGHIREISGLCLMLDALHPWLTTEQAQTELVDEVLGKHRGKTSDDPSIKKPTVAVVREAAKKWKSLIEKAKESYESLPADGDWRQRFVEQIAADEARTIAAINAAFSSIAEEVAVAAQEAADAMSEKAKKQSKEARKAAYIAAMTGRVRHGDAAEIITEAPVGFELLLTDPPYGMDYQSQRRKTTAKKEKIDNDTLEEAMTLIESVLKASFDLMAENATALVFTGWRYEPRVRHIVESCGFTVKGVIVWAKKNHGTGDLEGSFAPSHEWIIHAVKGTPKLRKRHRDTLRGVKFVSDHPTEKPHDLLKQLIEATTDKGQTVVDPFLGSGGSIIQAFKMGRQFFGIESSERWHRHCVDEIHTLAGKMK